jgi:hypothetical protein
MKDWDDIPFEDLVKRMQRSSEPPVNKSWNKKLPYPHYSDRSWDTAQVMFGKEEKGLTWEYSDRLWQWDHKKSQESYSMAGETHGLHTPAYYQEYLRLFYDDAKLQLKCIKGGTNSSSGFAYYVFGFKR